jgi:hypothetical protein
VGQARFPRLLARWTAEYFAFLVEIEQVEQEKKIATILVNHIFYNCHIDPIIF